MMNYQDLICNSPTTWTPESGVQCLRYSWLVFSHSVHHHFEVNSCSPGACNKSPNYWWDNLALMFYLCITWVYCNLASVDLTSWFQFLGLDIEVVSSYTHWRYVDKEMLYSRSNFGDISFEQLAKGHELGRPQNLSSSSPSIKVACWISASCCLVWSLCWEVDSQISWTR